MSGRIEECDASSVEGDRICADRLCDSARFASCHVCLSDRVEKGSLAVVYMAHDTDNRRSGDHILFGILFFAKQFLNDIDFLFFLAEDVVVKRDLFRLVILHFAVRSHDLTSQEQLLDDLRRIHMHGFSQFSDRELLGNSDRLDLLLDSSFHLFLRADELSGLVAASSVRFILIIDEILFGTLIALLVHLSLIIISVLLSFSAESLALTGSAGCSAASAFRHTGSCALTAGCRSSCAAGSLSGLCSASAESALLTAAIISSGTALCAAAVFSAETALFTTSIVSVISAETTLFAASIISVISAETALLTAAVVSSGAALCAAAVISSGAVLSLSISVSLESSSVVAVALSGSLSVICLLDNFALRSLCRNLFHLH